MVLDTAVQVALQQFRGGQDLAADHTISLLQLLMSWALLQVVVLTHPAFMDGPNDHIGNVVLA